MVDRLDDRRWRKALKLVGRAALEEHLRRYPGRPQDEVADLPVQPPFPTREFCQEWLLTNNETFRAYRTLIFVFGTAAVLGFSYAGCSLGGFTGSNTSMTPTTTGPSWVMNPPSPDTGTPAMIQAPSPPGTPPASSVASPTVPSGTTGY